MEHFNPRLLRPLAYCKCQRVAGQSKAHSTRKTLRFNDKEPEGNGRVGNEMQGPGIRSRNGDEANPEDDAK